MPDLLRGPRSRGSEIMHVSFVNCTTVPALMYACGDGRTPYQPTVDLVEELAVRFVEDLLHKAMDMGISDRLTWEDIVLVLRRVRTVLALHWPCTTCCSRRRYVLIAGSAQVRPSEGAGGAERGLPAEQEGEPVSLRGRAGTADVNTYGMSSVQAVETNNLTGQENFDDFAEGEAAEGE